MTISSRIRFVIFPFCGLVLFTGPSAFAGSGPAERWIEHNAIPLSVDPKHDLADMKPLGHIIGDARIVQLGEATHGTREFFQLKHRMVEYLATQKGFTIFSIEANMPEAYRLNRFVMHGEGDPKQLLKDMDFWTWDTQEVLDMILWMRDYNRSGNGHIEFTGFDMQLPAASIDIVNRFERKYDNTYLYTLSPIYKLALQSTHPAVPFLGVAPPRIDSLTLSRKSEAVRDHMAANEDSYLAAGATRQETEWAIQNATLVLQYAQLRAGQKTRDQSMAENIDWIARQNSTAKIIVWAHNGHVGAGGMGGYLRKAFPGQVFTFGFAFNEGSFQAISEQKGSTCRLCSFAVAPAPSGSWDNAFAEAGMSTFALDLRHLPTDPAARGWMNETHSTRNVGAMYDPSRPTAFFRHTILREEFDAVLFVEKTSASHSNEDVRKGTPSPSTETSPE